MQEKGWVALHTRKTSILQGWGEQGIDAVFKRGEEYFIVEGKYRGYATLKMTNDGKQMSDPWISNRLLNAVGGDELLEAQVRSNYKRLLAEIAPDGSTVYKELDEFANVIEVFTNF